MKRKQPVFPREDYAALELYGTERDPVEVDLSDNTNLWGAHPAALELVRRAEADQLTRYPDFYADALRRAAAERLGVGPGNVCTGAGSDHVLDAAFRSCAASGGTIAYAVPTFVMVEHFARVNARALRPVGWQEALADPERLLHHDPALVYVCRPNNPTGHLAPLDWMRHLLDAAGPEGPLVVLDEAYADFAPAEEGLVQEAAARSRLLVVRTLSKAFGLAGLRVGLGVASPEVAREVEKSRGPYMVSSLAERAAVAVLEDREAWVERTLGECLENRSRLESALQERGLTPLPSAANFLLVPLPDGSALRWGRGLRARQVAVRVFGSLPEVGDALRVTVGPWPLMERFLAALDDLRAEEAQDDRVRVELERGGRAAAP